MKILAIHSVGWFDDVNKEAQKDLWRIYRPLKELEKHVDWQIDYQRTFIKDIDKYKDTKEFTDEELEKAAQHLGQYDIVFSSYIGDVTPFLLMQTVAKRYGTKLVLDFDDDVFSINPDNPFWNKMTDENAYFMQNMAKLTDNICVTTKVLADKFNDRREQPRESITVIPNMISDDYRGREFDNGDKIVVGYFGGSTHYRDLHESGAIQAVEKIMHKHKNVHFKLVNLPTAHYTPRGRTHYVDGIGGSGWVDKLHPTLDIDISLIPVIDNQFNAGKSNIKWQESTRGNMATICSNLEPYLSLPNTATVHVDNTQESWFEAIEHLLDEHKRTKMLNCAQKHLSTYRLEDNWFMYQEMFKRVMKSN
jgi:hypothetical protein